MGLLTPIKWVASKLTTKTEAQAMNENPEAVPVVGDESVAELAPEATEELGPMTIEESLGGSGDVAAVLDQVVPAIQTVIEAKVAEIPVKELPFKVENNLDGIEPVLCFGIGRNGQPGHWFEYRPME
jgi:hypothetical protein